MPNVIEINTERLLLRPWKPSDFNAFSIMNANKRVMAFYPSTLTKAESDQMAKTCKQLIEKRGWGFWALEEKKSARFIGFTGLHIPRYDLPFQPCVEIGWRLSDDYWGAGFATEAAKAALAFGFNQLNLEEIVSFTTVNNQRSISVMKKLNMQKTAHHFDHPALPEGHALREHVLYKLNRHNWHP